MARDLLRVWMKLDNLHCYDEGDGWGSAEPYLWTTFFKIDGDSVALSDALKLTGTATIVPTPGSHGNLGASDVDDGDDVAIPAAIGEWSPLLTPIPVADSLKPLLDDLGGVIGVVCVLMEEDNVTDDGAEAGHAALDDAVKTALDDIIATRTFANPEITDSDIDQYVWSAASRKRWKRFGCRRRSCSRRRQSVQGDDDELLTGFQVRFGSNLPDGERVAGTSSSADLEVHYRVDRVDPSKGTHLRCRDDKVKPGRSQPLRSSRLAVSMLGAP